MEKSRVTMKQITAGIAGVIVLTVIDQLTKLWAIAELKGQPSIIWIKGIFELQYLENRGAAFGLMQNQQWLFLICVAVVLELPLTFITVCREAGGICLCG